jgi:hypothetical protein
VHAYGVDQTTESKNVTTRHIQPLWVNNIRNVDQMSTQEHVTGGLSMARRDAPDPEFCV